MAKIRLTGSQASDPRVGEGETLTIEIPDNKTGDHDFVDRAIDNYIDARYGPKQPIKTPQEAVSPNKTVKPINLTDSGQPLGPPAGVKRFQIPGLSDVAKPVEDMANTPTSGESGAKKTSNVIRGVGTMASAAMAPAMGANPLLAIKSALGAGFGQFAGEGVANLSGADPDTSQLIGDVSAFPGAILGGSPKVTAGVKGAVNNIAQHPPSYSRASIGGVLGGIAGLAHGDHSVHGMYTGAGAGALAEGALDLGFRGVQGFNQSAKAAPWLDPAIAPANESPINLTRNTQPTDIHPSTKAEGQSAYVRPRIEAPGLSPDNPMRSQGAIPMGPATQDRPFYPPGTAPEPSTGATMAPWSNPLQLGPGQPSAGMPIPMPPAGTSNMTSLPVQKSLPAPSLEVPRTRGAIPMEGPKTIDTTASVVPEQSTAKPVTKKVEPIRPPVKTVESKTETPKSEPPKEEPKVEEKKAEPDKTKPISANEMIEKVKKTPKDTDKPGELEKDKKQEKYTLKDVFNIADQMGVTQSSVARWLLKEGHTVERSNFGNWSAKAGKKDIQSVIDKMGPAKFEAALKQAKGGKK